MKTLDKIIAKQDLPIILGSSVFVVNVLDEVFEVFAKRNGKYLAVNFQTGAAVNLFNDTACFSLINKPKRKVL